MTQPLDGIDALVARLHEHMPPPARYALYLVPPPGAATLSAKELLGHETLARFFVGALSDLTDTPARQDQRIAAQRFVKKYTAAILPASLLPLAGGVAIDASLDRLRFIVEGDLLRGVMLAALDARTSSGRPAAWPIDAPAVRSLDDLRAHALETLFYGNLVPAVDAVLRVAHVSRRMLWCGVSEQIDLFYSGARLAGVGDPATLDADREVVLNAETLPGTSLRNPNHGTFTLEYEPRLDRLFMVRGVCCMQFRLRDPARYCTNCGLPTREERGVLRLKSAQVGNDPRVPVVRGSPR
jgi:ferric iron reductase protein FhuF